MMVCGLSDHERLQMATGLYELSSPFMNIHGQTIKDQQLFVILVIRKIVYTFVILKLKCFIYCMQVLTTKVWVI